VKKIFLFAAALFVVMLAVSPVNAQSDGGAASFRVFFDCDFFCDTQYLKEQLPIVDFVTERTQADVHVLHGSQSTASAGERVTLTFFGRRAYEAMSDTLTYTTTSEASSDDERKELVHYMTLGLTRYMVKAGLGGKMSVSAEKPDASSESTASIADDPWDYWVFSVGGSGNVNGQESTKFMRRRANFSANRTTDALKIRFTGNLSENTSEFTTDDDVIKNTNSSGSLYGQVVFSVGSNWAIGGTSRLSTSSFSNTERRIEAGPAIEYNIFPYSESTRRYLAVQYGLMLEERQYDELTIFALKQETVARHFLELSASTSQKWGSLSISADVNHLITNFDRSLTDSYNLGLFGSANVRLFRGLSFNTFVSYNRIRDQIDLPAESATTEEILLQSVQLPTGYSYQVNFGFTYRFGSIFNNVVNPRMGGGGGNTIFFL